MEDAPKPRDDEWALQEDLTRTWASGGLQIGGRSYCLLAWEVMTPSWDINYYLGRWNEPSVDFIVADFRGRLACIELKRAVLGRPRERMPSCR